jgi:hypothetical protein
MMETAQNRRAANDVPGGDAMAVPVRRGMRGWHRYPRAQTHVRSAVIEMRDPRFQSELQVALVQRNQKVQAFAA